MSDPHDQTDPAHNRAAARHERDQADKPTFTRDGLAVSRAVALALAPVIVPQAEAQPPISLASVAPAPEATEMKVAATAPSGPSIRIDLAKLDRLIDTVGELVIAQAMMAQRLSLSGLGSVDEIAVLEDGRLVGLVDLPALCRGLLSGRPQDRMADAPA